MLPNESLYIGVDIGKFKHVSGFVSKTLLERHKHFEHCPAFLFEQSREGFRAFVERVRAYCPLAACRRERTGSHASRSASACVIHGTGTSARTACGRKRNRVSNSDPTNWKDAPIPTLRSG